MRFTIFNVTVIILVGIIIWGAIQGNWLKIGIALGILAVVIVGTWISDRKQRSGPKQP